MLPKKCLVESEEHILNTQKHRELVQRAQLTLQLVGFDPKRCQIRYLCKNAFLEDYTAPDGPNRGGGCEMLSMAK